MTTKRKPGRPPTHESGAMPIFRVRLPQGTIDWLKSKGVSSEVARELLVSAHREDVEAANNETTG